MNRIIVFMVLIITHLAICKAAPYELKVYTHPPDEFKNEHDTTYTYCLKGNCLSGTDYPIQIELTKYSKSAGIYLTDIYLEFYYNDFHLQPWEKNLIMLIDGVRNTFECSVSEGSKYFPHRASLTIKPTLLLKIATAKEVKVKFKEFLLGGEIAGYIDEDTRKNFLQFYNEFVLKKGRVKGQKRP